MEREIEAWVEAKKRAEENTLWEKLQRWRDGGQKRKSQVESIICETEMDHGPLWSLIPLLYVTVSPHRVHTCTASGSFCFSLGCNKTQRASPNTGKSKKANYMT